MTIPEKIGRYAVKSELGRGGMATVYRAYDPSFEREVAIKVLPRELMHDPQFRDRFRREIKTIASLEHPAIVPVYDVGEEDGVPYFVMRFMPGGSLSQWIEKGKFSLEDAARIIERLSSALAYAHKNGLVHRDLKPDNILFDSNGDPFISDFGVAKITDSATNMTGSGIIGTPAYMSPEQAQGEQVDNRSDIYGLGVIIFQMLSGHQPYEATTPMGVAVKHITDPVPEILKVNPSLPGQTDTIIKTAMAKDPSLRYQTATELAHALSEAAFGKKPATQAARAPAQPAKARATAGGSKRGLVIGGIIGLVVVVAGGAAVVLGSGLLAPAPPPTQTVPAPTETPLPTATVEPTIEPTSGPVMAPVCAPGVVPEIPVPDIQEGNQYCVNKRAVTDYSIPLGATFTSLRDGYTCDLKNQQGGRQVINCYGPQNLTKFDLQVCLPIPTPSTSTVVGQCAEGSEYNYDNACCAPPKPENAGCMIYEISLRACG
ncbi:MAG TPA: serine/threonine-protein kinase, partial [Anaerolineales bacterium]|nr:serine/threonine-protein kinase [Anaerolineales bacterium]